MSGMTPFDLDVHSGKSVKKSTYGRLLDALEYIGNSGVSAYKRQRVLANGTLNTFLLNQAMNLGETRVETLTLNSDIFSVVIMRENFRAVERWKVNQEFVVESPIQRILSSQRHS